ncbi:MAG: hypothetical protein ACXVCN_19475 [Bdellovibrio sp.]
MKAQMKSNESKAMKWIRTSLFSAALLTSLAGLAGEGGGSGNGNGDEAFALQTLAKENPGLQPYEVLIKAFNESIGRPLELSFQPVVTKKHDGPKEPIEYIERAYLLGKSDQNCYQFEDLNDPTVGSSWVKNFAIDRQVLTDGSLLGNNKPIIGSLYEYINNPVYFYIGKIDSKTGMAKTYNLNLNLEFRQYNSKIVIFAVHPVMENGVRVCMVSNKGLTFKEYDYVKKPVPSSGLCSIGYIWKD